MVPGSTLIYGSSFCAATLRPRDFNNLPKEAAVSAAEGLETEKTRSPVAKSVDGRIPSDEIYRLATKDEKVRLQIIGEYLRSLGKTGAPITAGGVGALASPPKMIRDIQDAGKMALQLFQK